MSIRTSAFKSLELEHVGRSFGGQRALADLSLTINSGEFIALLGPSGCGKSTALNCLAGLLPLTAGRILLDGVQIDRLPPEQRGFGMVFQNYALFPHLNVEKNIAFGLQMRRVPREQVRARVAEAIELVQLGPHAKKLPGQLSGGQQQRVAIARAVVLRPPLVLMDEPLSNLDAKLRLEMRTEIRRLHQSLGLTTIYVTHDQEEALSLADRLVVLRLGRMQQIGTPQQLHEQPANWHVADFMGYRNLFEAVADTVRGHTVTVPALGTVLTGTSTHDLAPGSRVRVALRPEDLEIMPDGGERPDERPGEPPGPGGHPGPGTLPAMDGGPHPDGCSRISATVEVVEYQGREFAVEVRTGDGQVLHLRSARRVGAGDRLTLTAAPERVLIFPAELDAAPAGSVHLEAAPS